MNNFEALLEWMEEGNLDELNAPKGSMDHGYASGSKSENPRAIHKDKMKPGRSYEYGGKKGMDARRKEIAGEKSAKEQRTHKAKIDPNSKRFDYDYDKLHKDKKSAERINKSMDKHGSDYAKNTSDANKQKASRIAASRKHKQAFGEDSEMDETLTSKEVGKQQRTAASKGVADRKHKRNLKNDPDYAKAHYAKLAAKRKERQANITGHV